MNALIARCSGGLAGLILRSLPLLTFLCLVRPEAKAGQIPQFAFTIHTAQVSGGAAPGALAVDAGGGIYMASGSNIIKFARNGDYVSSWLVPAAGPPAASSLMIAIDSMTNIYVSEKYPSQVEKFDRDGHLLTRWGTYGDGPGQFQTALGIALDSSGQVYVADLYNGVQIFSDSGAFLGYLGSAGTNAGQFHHPALVAIDSSDNVYVADFPDETYPETGAGSFRVQKFDTTGNFLTLWRSQGSDNPGFLYSSFQGLAIDPDHNVHLADSYRSIEKYTTDGTFIGDIGGYGAGPGQFLSPRGLAVDRSGNYVYLAHQGGNSFNDGIHVYAYSAFEPLIYQSPTNQVIPAGTNLTVAAGVFGAQPLSYQWRYNGTDLPGETNSSLTISNAALSNSGTYSIFASNALGTAMSSNSVISVIPIVVTTLPVFSLTLTSAVLNGTVVLGPNASSAWFEWGTDTNYGTTVARTNLGANASVAISYPLSNLIHHVTYHYRLVGSNSLGVIAGNDLAFEPGLKPQVTTLPIRPTGPGSVALEASVNPNGRPTSVFFRWGNIPPSGSTSTNTSGSQVGSGITPVPVQDLATGLPIGFYSVQAIASNQLGSVTGNIVRFVAPPWTLIATQPQNRWWKSLASSADGRRLAGVVGDDRVWLSSDSGMSWTNRQLPGSFNTMSAISMSADGKRLVAGTAGPALFSVDFGNTWTIASTPDHNWIALASSADGVAVAGADSTARIVLTSTNSGLNWRTNSPPVSDQWSSIASSADGRTLIVAGGGVSGTNGLLYTSTNAGLSWTSNNFAKQFWSAVASSADGHTLLAAIGGGRAGPIYVSTNAGASWSSSSAPLAYWQSLAISADGTHMAALGPQYNNQLFTSTNAGLTWEWAGVPYAFWRLLVSSADGARLLATSYTDILALQTTPAPQLETQIAGSQLLVSWTVPSQPFTLQQANDLSAPQWTDVTNAPLLVYTNVHYQVAVPASNAGGFYRLRGQ